MENVGQAILRRRRDFAVDLVQGFGIVARGIDGRADIKPARIGYGFAGVEAFQQGQIFRMFGHQVGQFVQDFLAGLRCQPAPATILEGGARRDDGVINIGGVTGGDAVDQFPITRRVIVEGAA